MKQLFLIIFLTSSPLLTVGQVDDAVSLTDLIREIQQWNKNGNKMSMTWWVPSEYWKLALKDNKQLPPETITHFENVFVDYVLIWACDLTINSDGTMDFTQIDEIKNSISVTDNSDKKHFPLANDKVNQQALSIAENMKPLFAQALGQMGRGLHFFFFQIKDVNNRNLISATQPGGFKVSHSNSEFYWRLPLVTLLPLKYCPIDNEKMKGNWNYCPIHGEKL